MAEGSGGYASDARPGYFSQRLEDLYRRRHPQARLILISFPHNPHHAMCDLPLLSEIIRLASHDGSWCCMTLLMQTSALTAIELPASYKSPEPKELAVEVFSMSKSYNMAGWRVGFCLGNKKMITALARIKSYLDYGVFQPLQIAAIIALRECEDDTKRICAVYQKRRDLLSTA